MEQSVGYSLAYQRSTPIHILCLLRGQNRKDSYHAKYICSKLHSPLVHLFTNRSVALILWQTFFVGIVYYGNLYYLPIFSQVLQKRSIIASGVLLLPLIMTQTVVAVLAGFIVHRSYYSLKYSFIERDDTILVFSSVLLYGHSDWVYRRPLTRQFQLVNSQDISLQKALELV